jgi:prepilin-type N-terminal cleavage/methylation domain-containing protein
MTGSAGEHRGRRGRRGFSVIELLVVVAVTSVGFVALLELQVASIRGLSYPANVTAALNLGEHFLATLRLEAVEWTGNGTQQWNNPNLRYLKTLNPAAAADDPNAWQLAYGISGAPDNFTDQGGSDVVYDTGLTRELGPRDNPRFCVHYRLAWATGSERLMRAEVRVMWLRDEGSFALFKQCPLNMAQARYQGQVQSVTLTDQILINTNI